MTVPFPKKTIGSLMLAAVLAACQSTRIDTGSRISLPAAFSQTQAAADTQNIARWWQNWHDPVLTQLVEQGLRSSHDIKIAQSRLTEAQAQAKLAHADLGAQIGLTGQASVSQSHIKNPLDDNTRAALSTLPKNGGLDKSTLSHHSSHPSMYGGIQASWEPDIFGQKRSDADAAQAVALGLQEQYCGAQMLLAGNIAEHYFQIRALQAQQKATAQSIAALERMTQYVRGRFRAGQATAYEINEAESKLAAMRGQQSTEAAQIAQHTRALAVLVGQTPQTFVLPESRADILGNPPAAPEGAVPSDVLANRPDLRARAAAVQGYAAKLASAKADLLPRFSIKFLGMGGRIEVGSDTALKGWGDLFSVGISVPIFTNGRIKANIAAADARLQTALLEYDRNVLQALTDVDNAYQMQAALGKQNTLLAQAERQTAKQARDAQSLFRYGSKTLDNALTARISHAQAQTQLIHSQLARAQALVGLYKALGGGWTADGQ